MREAKIREDLDKLGPPMQHCDMPFNGAGFGFIERKLDEEASEGVPAVCIRQLDAMTMHLSESDLDLVLMGIAAWFQAVISLETPGFMVNEAEMGEARAVIESELPEAARLMTECFDFTKGG